MNAPFFLLGQTSSSNSAIVTFVAYIAIVLFLAWLSSRMTSKGSFLSEYFLGGRNLGVWTFALTFAATSASGGSFIGFPSMVYTHGWSVGLWIASYMLMPLVAMALLAKRLNQLARKTDAITVPDLLRARFESPLFALVATLMIVFFLSCNLVAQFKGGSVILQSLLRDVPLFQQWVASFAALVTPLGILPAGVEPAYVLCLLVFALAVVVYTTYGGFRAVVWTDVLQGMVMVLGILLLLPMTLAAVGGLGAATRDLSQQMPPTRLRVPLHSTSDSGTPAALRKNSLVVVADGERERIFRTAETGLLLESGRVVSRQAFARDEMLDIEVLELHVARGQIEHEPLLADFELRAATGPTTEYAYGAGTPGVYTSLPGPSPSSDIGFLPLSVALSFFCYWCFGSAGQPSNMIRCMAFQNSGTLARAIFTVSVYFSLIYFPIVIIFCCARTLLPGWETESDRIMPEMARAVTAIYGVPWLAGLLVAAPFAAVMSTMDSFLLMISSALVRDIYGRWINPDPSERQTKRLTYAATFVVGVVAMLASVNPPRFLQDIIVFTGAGLATSFLVPVALALYWPRFNYQGAVAGMLVGFFSNVVLYVIGTYQTGSMSAYEPFGLSPFLVGCLSSLAASLAVCMTTRPPSRELVLKFFYRKVEK